MQAIKQIIPWAFPAALCFWFLFIHTPTFLFDKKKSIEPLLCVHLFSACSIYLACLHNTLLIPSLFDGKARPYHVWIGRIGLALGVVGFCSGFYLTWFILDPKKDLGFSIGITSGGIAQIVCEFNGYRSIRKFQQIKERLGLIKQQENGQNNDDDNHHEANPMQEEERYALEDEQDHYLSIHIKNMIGLLFLACGIPALMRIPKKVGDMSVIVPLALIMCCMGYFMERPILTTIKEKRATERYLKNRISSTYKSFGQCTTEHKSQIESIKPTNCLLSS